MRPTCEVHETENEVDDGAFFCVECDEASRAAMWRTWGAYRYRWLRLPRYWLALLACRRQGHRWNAHSDDRRGCTRCWKWED